MCSQVRKINGEQDANAQIISYMKGGELRECAHPNVADGSGATKAIEQTVGVFPEHSTRCCACIRRSARKTRRFEPARHHGDLESRIQSPSRTRHCLSMRFRHRWPTSAMAKSTVTSEVTSIASDYDAPQRTTRWANSRPQSSVGRSRSRIPCSLGLSASALDRALGLHDQIDGACRDSSPVRVAGNRSAEQTD